MMRAVVVSLTTITLMFGLLSIADAKPPKAKAGAKANEHRSEKSLDASNSQKNEDATRGLERAGERQSEAAVEHSKAKGQQQAAKKGDREGGWFDRAGKFLGVGRSDEKRSEQEAKKGAKAAEK